jgi:PhnB protein
MRLAVMTIVNGRPDGYTTLTPFLVCSPAAEAIDFYCQVFGASVVSRMDGPDGRVLHAELDLGTGRLQLGDPAQEYGLVPPSGQDQDQVSASVCIYVPDVDAAFAAAVERGAVVREKPGTFVTGDRFASVYDPFGHRWAIMTRVEDVSPEEAERRLAEWAATSG